MPLALVTGASSGIGAATARALAAEGYRVVLVARGAEALRRVAEGMPGEPIVEALDAADAAAVEAMAARVISGAGVPDVVVNSAGAGAWKDLDETPPAELVAMMGAPYFAAALVTRAFLPGMLARRSGVVVHVGSPVSALVWPGATGYAATRWALRGLNEALNADLHGTGVRSCHVVFGEVSSAYFDTNAGARERLPGIARTVRTLTPEECARVILRAIRRPRREIRAPLMLRLYYAAHAVVPWKVRWLLRVTGRRRPARATPSA